MKPRDYSISIGKDQRIEWVDTTVPTGDIANIDKFIRPMDDVWTRLETNCIAECCGIDAFVLWPDDIKAACAGMDTTALRDQLGRLRQFIVSANYEVYESSRLNNLFHRTVLLQLIDHISAHITVN